MGSSVEKMGSRLLTVEEGTYNHGRRKERMNPVVLDWNQRYEIEHAFLKYTDR